MIKIIVAIDKNNGIGYQNTLPWKNKADMTHFKQTTTNSVVVMGRKTFNSLNNKPLPNRVNIVLTKDKNFKSEEDIIIFNSFDEIINYSKNIEKDVFIIGGSEIYKQALGLNIVDELIISHINGEYKCDTYFPFDITNLITHKQDIIDDTLTVKYYHRLNELEEVIPIIETKDIVKSVGNTNKDIISDIMRLYNIEQFDLDCTYSSGSFWKGLPQPINKTDLHPKDDTIIQADSGSLPFDNETMNNIMFDPPFVIVGPGKYHEHKEGSTIIAKRFEGYANFNELKSHYYRTLKELYRLLKKDGLVVFKCQDTVSGGRQHMTEHMVLNMAQKVGFQLRDKFILAVNNRINSFNGGTWKKQQHARKYHSYFLVLKKCKDRVDYSFEHLD